MSGTTRAGSYRAVLALPSASSTFAAALVGRLSYGLLPLSLLFTVRDATGSFAVAGSALGLVGLTSLALPTKSRLVDRFGSRATLPVMAMAAGLALAGICLGPGPFGCVTLSGLAGLATPPLGPTMRAVWSRLTDGPDGPNLRAVAYSLDAVAEEALYVLGPVLVGVALDVAAARFSLLATAVVMVVGTLGMVLVGPTAASVASPGARTWSPLRTSGFMGLLAAMLLVATALSLATTAVAAAAQATGQPSAAGWVDAGLAGGSVVGGLLWGQRRQGRSWRTHVAGLAVLLAVGPAVAVTGSGLFGIGVAMTVTGLAVSPLFVVAYLAADRLAPGDRRVEAGTWVNVGHNVGSAAGSAVGGFAVQAFDSRSAFALALVLLLVVSGSAARRREG